MDNELFIILISNAAGKENRDHSYGIIQFLFEV